MKKNLILSGIALFTFLALPFVVSAQLGASATTAFHDLSLSVDGSALLAVRNTAAGATTTGISMSLQGATEAGAEVMTTITNSDTRLRISSLVESGKTRNISVGIAPALTGSGTELHVLLTKPNNFLPAVENGGTPLVAELNLTAGATAPIVTGITTCWSGTGDTDGYTVRYRYAKTDGATALISRVVTVTYTISGEV